MKTKIFLQHFRKELRKQAEFFRTSKDNRNNINEAVYVAIAVVHSCLLDALKKSRKK